MNMHCFQHVGFESPGTIVDWAGRHGHALSYTCFYEEGYHLPAHHEYDALLIMGGYMNVDEEDMFPWLAAEKQCIAQAIRSGKKVLGICLGAQLIASAMGASVYKGREKEIGFFPVRFTDAGRNGNLFSHYPEEYTLFHWHGDTFDLPDGATLIASTAVCRHQAFMIGDHVMALQFHPEMNETCIEQMIRHEGSELEETGTCIQSVDEIRSHYGFLSQNREDLFQLLDRFFG